MKEKELKPLDYFKPFESTEPYVECKVNPDTGVYKIIVYGRVQNMKDYDFKNSSEIEIFNKLPETCNNQTLVENGLMFFAGTVALSKKFFLAPNEITNRTLKFDKLMACHATIRINGKLAGELYWHPFELDIAGFLKPGENTIEIELKNGLRNLLGPHHLEEGESGQVSPFSFLKEEDILGRIPNSYNHEYNFVQLGFSGLKLC